MIHYPRVDIRFCTKCRWNLRAAWYLQELLSTFGPALGEVAMAPAESGVFQVYLQASADSEELLLWDRKQRGGFPDSKDLKQLVRDEIAPTQDLGHSDRKPPKDVPAAAPVAAPVAARAGSEAATETAPAAAPESARETAPERAPKAVPGVVPEGEAGDEGECVECNAL